MTDNEPKQVIVMRTDLNMRKGKMIAQGAHASIAFLTNKMSLEMPNQGELGMEGIVSLSEPERLWLTGRFIKICVQVNSEDELLDIHARAQEAGLVSTLITDAGLTEFDGVPTNTCCAIGPDFAERIDPITGHLKLL